MRYRKKPVIIDAFQYDGDLMGSDGKYYVPDWAVNAFQEGIMQVLEIILFEELTARYIHVSLIFLKRHMRS